MRPRRPARQASFSLNADGCKFGEGPVPSSGTGRRLLGYLRARKDVKAMGLLPAAMSHDRWRRRQQGRGGSLLEVGSALPNENGFPGIGTMKSFREMVCGASPPPSRCARAAPDPRRAV